MNQQELEKIQLLYSQKIRSNPVLFANKILGIPLHQGQLRWIKNANKKINILRPGNRWGKSLVTAILHVWHCMTKINLQDDIDSTEAFFNAKYETLNFGPAYEQSREVLRLAVDIVEGRIVIPKKLQEKWGKNNRSILKGWAIANDRSEAQMLPYLEFITGSKLLARSYSDMGAAFKSKAISYMSGDECADIPELWTFTNVTLLPRLVSTKGILHFVGTIQSEGFDYMQMIEMAEADMEGDDYATEGMFYVQKGSMYENEFLDSEEIDKTAKIADEDIRMQIIEGEHVETGDKYFGYARINNAIDKNLELLEYGFDTRKYLTTADFAGGDSKWSDFTVIQVIDYTEEPYRVVYFFRVKGKDMPIPMQYEKVTEVVEKFPGKLIIDSSALGGKNAKAYLAHLHPICLDISARIKGEMLSTLKTAFDGSKSTKYRRELVEDDAGNVYDKNEQWGIVKIPDIKPLVKELRNYKLDDKKIITDCVMSLAQGIYYIEMRRPKMVRRQAVDFDMY